MSYGVGTCILPIARRLMFGSLFVIGAYLQYDLVVRPVAHKVMLKFEDSQPPKNKSNGH